MQIKTKQKTYRKEKDCNNKKDKRKIRKRKKKTKERKDIQKNILNLTLQKEKEREITQK